MPGVYLTQIKTDQFKTCFMSASLLKNLSVGDASINALMPHVLRRGTTRYPDMQSISAALDNMYGARLEPAVRKKGDVQCVGFASSVIDDAYAPGNTLIEDAARMMGECLLSPVLENGVFKEEYVAGERANLVDRIRSQINDKRIYARNRLTELMCADEPYGVNVLGSEQAAAAVTAGDLHAFYQSALSACRVELFFCGNDGHARAQDALRRAFEALPRTGSVTPVKNGIRLRQGKLRTVEESLDVTQGKLSIGFRTGITADDQTLPAMMMLNAVFGGTTTSKLFMNVRERLSLCYYASSVLDRLKGVLNVYSGIEFDRFETARDEIFAQLEACRRGEIEDWELEGARSVVISTLRSYLDSQASLEDFWLSQSIAGLTYTPQEMAARIEKVTREQVVACAKAVEPDTIYFLKGTI